MKKKKKEFPRFNPSDFMKARRPELYPDTILKEEFYLNRNEFEFHLDTLTQRKEEIRFEHFCRRLAEREICPNLIIQTGPTGGGDSKVDSETYQVAKTISDRWYEGDPKRAGRERWAFAFSAKKRWRDKVKKDIENIVKTERSYSLIYFITNQSVRDRDRAEMEDDLRKKWGTEVRILDRSWIVAKVTENKRWDIVYQTLDIERPRKESTTLPGPLDAERQRDLEEIDRQIQDSNRYEGCDYQLAEDCLQSALLARGLGRPRQEIDGRFDRAERIARSRGNNRQLFRILYHRAWTVYFWFDDFSEFDRYYSEAEALVIDSEWIWDLELLVNLWMLGNTWRQTGDKEYDAKSWATRTTKLRNALQIHVDNSDKPNSALWARTQFLFINIADAVANGESIQPILTSMKNLLVEAEGHLDYPMGILFRVVQELGPIMCGDDTYDVLFEAVITARAKRVDEAEQGRMRLTQGFQKLKAGKHYDAINQLAKAQRLLAQDEHMGEFVRALVGTALGYEAVGLPWAARANLIMALDRSLYEYWKIGRIAPQSFNIIRKLIWIELKLGRVPCVFPWLKLLNPIAGTLQLNDAQLTDIKNDFMLMDVAMGILVLRTNYAYLSYLDRVAGLFEEFGLLLSRGAILFYLGHEAQLRSEYSIDDDNLDQFFSLWLQQPMASDISVESEWHVGNSVKMHSVILGCNIELIAENNTSSIVLGETILAILESLMSTAIKVKGQYSARPNLKFIIRKSEQAETPFSIKIEEDDCGESSLYIEHATSLSDILGKSHDLHDSLEKLIASFIAELQVSFTKESLKDFFSRDLALDRTLWAVKSSVSHANLLGDKPQYHLEDLIDDSITESLALIRNEPWKATSKSDSSDEERNELPLSFADGPPPKNLLDVDNYKHGDMQILSPINLALWDKAHWTGMGFAFRQGDPPLPELLLLFRELEIGKKIFRGWRKQIGEVDSQDWIGITLITGIDRHHPAHYRVAIGISDEYLRNLKSPPKLSAITTRIHEMTPKDTTNIDLFIEAYKKAKKYLLSPGTVSTIQFVEPELRKLSILKSNLKIVPAWQIGPYDPLCVVLQRGDNPIIPSIINDPPVLKALDKMFGSSRGRS